MEADNQKTTYSLSSLRNEITQNEGIIDNYLRTAKNMKWMAVGTVLLSVFFSSVLDSLFASVLVSDFVSDEEELPPDELLSPDEDELPLDDEDDDELLPPL